MARVPACVWELSGHVGKIPHHDREDGEVGSRRTLIAARYAASAGPRPVVLLVSGISVRVASVSSKVPATDTAFSRATRATFVASMMTARRTVAQNSTTAVKKPAMRDFESAWTQLTRRGERRRACAAEVAIGARDVGVARGRARPKPSTR